MAATSARAEVMPSLPAQPGLSSRGLEITTGLTARAVEESCPQCGSAETVGGHGPSFSLTAAPRTEGPQEGRGGRSCPGSASGPEVEPLLCLHHGEGLPGRWSPEQPLWNETALGLLPAHTRKPHCRGLQRTRVYFSAEYKVQRRQKFRTGGQGLREPDSPACSIEV